MNTLILCLLVALVPDLSRAEFHYMAPGNYTYPEGDNLYMSCPYYYNPTNWRREGGRPLPEGSEIESGHLFLYNLKVEDSGTYYCADARGLQLPSRTYNLIIEPRIGTTTSTTTMRPTTSTTTMRPTTSTTTTRPTTAAPTTTTPSHTTTTEKSVTETCAKREQAIFGCLKAKHWSERQIQEWYDRVLNPKTRAGRVTRYDQDMVCDCVYIDDYHYYGVIPEGYTTTTTAPPPDTFSGVTDQERKILLCLRANGVSDQLIRTWYNTVLNATTRSGRVSRHYQDLAIKCIQPADYFYYGVTPDGFTTTTTTTTQAPATTTTTTATPPDTFSGVTDQERKILLCLRANGVSDQLIRTWYNTVLNATTRSGRVSRHYQDLAIKCIQPADYFYYGVTPDGFTTTTTTTTQAPATTTTTTATPPDTFSDVTDQERMILLCLRKIGMRDQLIRAWHNRVLNFATRSGRVWKHDQDLAIKCIQPVDYLNYGVSPDGYTTTTTPPEPLTATTPREQKMFDCLKVKRWSNLMIRKWYNRVLNPETLTGRATRHDQDMVGDCVHTDDYLSYGVTPDGYTPSFDVDS